MYYSTRYPLWCRAQKHSQDRQQQQQQQERFTMHLLNDTRSSGCARAMLRYCCRCAQLSSTAHLVAQTHGTMMARCTMRTSVVTRQVRPQSMSSVESGYCRAMSASSKLLRKLKTEDMTIKDQRLPRPRVAKEKRKQYLAQRQAAFEVEHKRAISLGLDWGIRSALILERLPVIVEEYPDWQRNFWNLQAQQAHYGAKFPAEMGFKYDDEKALTMEEVLEQSPIKLASRRTPADDSNDRTTLDRALDERLVLIIKPKSDAEWRLPESAWEAGETIRQAAERTARKVLVKTTTRKGQRDDVAQLHFVGNCPAGWFWRTASSQDGPNGVFGDKVFINRVQLIHGQPTVVKSEAAEHLWVTKHEIGEYLGDAMGVYLKQLI